MLYIYISYNNSARRNNVTAATKYKQVYLYNLGTEIIYMPKQPNYNMTSRLVAMCAPTLGPPLS